MTRQFKAKRKKLARGQFVLIFQTTDQYANDMSSKGLEYGSGSAAAPRMVTPPPPASSSDDAGERSIVSSMRLAARRHHTTTQSSPSSSRIQIKIDAPPPLLVSLNGAGGESNTTTISLGRSLHNASGIFRAPAANATSVNNNNVVGNGASAAGEAGATSTAPTSASDDALYAFLKLPGLSHDTMENDTDDEDESNDDIACSCGYVDDDDDDDDADEEGIVDIVYF